MSGFPILILDVGIIFIYLLLGALSAVGLLNCRFLFQKREQDFWNDARTRADA